MLVGVKNVADKSRQVQLVRGAVCVQTALLVGQLILIGYQM